MASVVTGTLAFVRAELVSTLRQPRLLVMLVLGPFLVLLVFGMGYERDLPALSTVVVGTEGSDLLDEVDTFVREEEPGGIAYRGTTGDRDEALSLLRSGTVDLVVVLPDRALDTIGEGDRAVIEVHERSLDPITSSQIHVAADAAVGQINDRVLEEVVATAQERTDGLAGEVADAREQLAQVRSRVSADDLATAQRVAERLAPRLSSLADTLGSSASIAGALGLGDRVDELASPMREGSQALSDLAAVDATGQLDRIADGLAELESALSQLQGVEASVVVRPFRSDVVSQTPVEVTLDRFYAPGLVALMLQHVALTFAALALVRERRQGTTELLEVAPVGLGERLAGKAIAFVLLGGLAAVVLTGLVVGVFGVPVPTDWGSFAGVLVLTLLASLGYGFLVAAASDTESQAVQFSMLFLLTAIFFSGLFMPLDRIGMPAEVVTWLMPATYAFAGLQQLMLLQRPAPEFLFAGLAAIAVVATGLAAAWLSLRARRLA